MSYAPFNQGLSNLTIMSNGSISKYNFDESTSKLYNKLKNKKECLFGKYLFIGIICLALVSTSIIALLVLSSNNKKSLIYIIGFIGMFLGLFFNQSQRVYILGFIRLILVIGIIIGLFLNQSQRVYVFGFIGLVLIGGFVYLNKLNNQSIGISKQIARLLKSNQV